MGLLLALGVPFGVARAGLGAAAHGSGMSVMAASAGSSAVGSGLIRSATSAPRRRPRPGCTGRPCRRASIVLGAGPSRSAPLRPPSAAPCRSGRRSLRPGRQLEQRHESGWPASRRSGRRPVRRGPRRRPGFRALDRRCSRRWCTGCTDSKDKVIVAGLNVPYALRARTAASRCGTG